MNKNDTLLTIGQIASMLGITRRIIINYEQQGLISADTRGDFNTGYRYYSMDTFTRIRTIRTYQKLGLSLREIKSYLDNTSDLTPVIARLEAIREELNTNIALLKERAKKVESEDITITTLPAHRVFFKTARDTSIELRTRHLREVASNAITAFGADLTKLMYFTDFSLEDPALVTYYAAVPPKSSGEFIKTIKESKAVAHYYHGSYENLPQVRRKLVNYANKNGINLSGVCRHIYLEGPPQHKDSKKFITLVALLIDEKTTIEK